MKELLRVLKSMIVPWFRKGDWVMLKHEINSPEDADKKTGKVKFSSGMMQYKYGAMKIQCRTKRSKKAYRVEENGYEWHRKWLVKIDYDESCMDNEKVEKYYFKEGDVVELIINNSYAHDYQNGISGRMRKLQGIPMTITSGFHIYHHVKENPFSWPINCLKLSNPEQSEKSKFNVGEWVVLKEDIGSPRDAFEAAGRSVGFNPFMKKWNKRFMKVKSVQMTSKGWVCQVNENGWNWHEEWLDKVR